MAERRLPSAEEFAAIVKRVGIAATPDLLEGYGLLLPHLARLRRGAAPEDEPAVTFQADKAGRP
jgi:hypothetical protein